MLLYCTDVRKGMKTFLLQALKLMLLQEENTAKVVQRSERVASSCLFQIQSCVN